MNGSEPDKPVPENPKCPQCGTALPAGALGGLCPACLLKQGTSVDTGPETTPFVPPSVADIAKLFPQLEIVRLLGKGGMGAVYLARQPSLDRMVALKILPAQSDETGFAERFAREARALARLSHPNIVIVYEFGVAGNLHYFLMEFVDGVNLRQLQLSGRLSPHEALQIVPQLCDALQYAHDEGVVHRDIKPENVLMDRKGRVKIADFGLAKMLGHDAGATRLTAADHVMGTPHYMSPEQYERPLEVDHRADIYSLGVVFYEMLTGELPIGRFAPPSTKAQIDVRLDEVVLRTLEKEPNRRYQHASQIKTAVDNITHSTPPPGATNAETLAQQIRARDYVLDIGSCISRGWALVMSDFFPLVGLTALMLILLAIAGSVGSTVVKSGSEGHTITVSSVLGVLVWGPLVGGLFLHYLRKIRREATGVDTAFSGFSKRFLHLFLGGFVTSMLTTIGFVLLVVPGVYLLVAWLFTLALIIDKQIDFWPAMELSRKVITQHWWKFLGLVLTLQLVLFAGALVCGVGIFVAFPVAIAALMYAYEDIFGSSQPARKVPPSGVGPAGTMVMPNTPARPAAPAPASPIPPAAAAPPAGSANVPPVLAAALLLFLTISSAPANPLPLPGDHLSALPDDASESFSTTAKGGMTDPSAVLLEAKVLTQKGNYQDALLHYLWYWRHAPNENAGSFNAHVSSLFEDWAELARRFPMAELALTRIRDRLTRELAPADANRLPLFVEIFSLNNCLDDAAANVALFLSLREMDPALAARCFPLVESMLVKNHEYALCEQYLPNSRAAFDGIYHAWLAQKQIEFNVAIQRRHTQELVKELHRELPDLKTLPATPLPMPTKKADANFIARTRLLIEILIGAGRQAEAARIHEMACAVLPAQQLQSAVSDAEKRADKHS